MNRHQCSAVAWHWPGPAARCDRRGIIQASSGKWYCADHTPQQHIKAQAGETEADNETTGDKP